VAHHDIPSKAHPSSSLLEHRADFAYTIIVHFVVGNMAWLHFECFASLSWQISHDGLLIKLLFEVPFFSRTTL
jgi:hypothetical protein